MLPLILIIAFSNFAQSQLHLEIHENSTELLNCAIRIYEQTKHIKTTLIIQSSQLEDIKYIAERIDSAMIINSNKQFKAVFDKYKFNYNFITAENIKEFEKNINKFYRSYSWTPRAKFLVVFTKKVNITSAFEIAWRISVLNIVIVHKEDENKIYTYFPYHNNSCANIMPNLIGLCDQNKNLSTNFYPDKVPAYLHGCPIKALVIYFPPFVINPNSTEKPGFEINMINAIGAFMNFTPVYIHHKYKSYGFKFSKGKYSNLFEMLYNYEGDIVFGNCKYNSSFNEEFDSTTPHLKVSVTWYAPIALQVAPWKNLILVFNQNLWVTIICTYFTSVFIWWIFGLIINDKYWKHIDSCAIYIWYSCFLGGIHVSNKLTMRILLASWIFSILVINSMYNTMFTSVLTNPLFEKQLSTLKGILRSGLQFGFDPISKDHFNYPKEKVLWEIYKNHVVCPHENMTVCFNRTIYDRDFVFAKNNKLVAYYLKYYYKFKFDKPMLYKFDRPAYRYTMRGLVNQGFPLLERFNQLVSRILSAGLIDKWNHDVGHSPPLKNPTDIVEAKQIGLVHLQGAIYVYCIGLMTSFLTLIFEIIMEKFKYYRKRNILK